MLLFLFQSNVSSDPPAGLLLSSQTFTAETSNTTTTTHITKVTFHYSNTKHCSVSKYTGDKED